MIGGFLDLFLFLSLRSSITTGVCLDVLKSATSADPTLARTAASAPTAGAATSAPVQGVHGPARTAENPPGGSSGSRRAHN